VFYGGMMWFNLTYVVVEAIYRFTICVLLLQDPLAY
jgi:hypothetical protein